MADRPLETRSSTGTWTSGFLSCGGDEPEALAVSGAATAAAGPLPVAIHGDADHVVGSLLHDGDVEIHGDVREGIEIVAAGSVHVAGDVQGSRVVAGGDVVVAGAVGGPGSPVVEAGGNVSFHCARFATILAGGDIVVGDYLARSTVTAYGQVSLTQRRGHLAGGRTRAVGGMSVRRLGSSLGRHTRVALGRTSVAADHETLASRLSACSVGLSRVARRLAELDSIVEVERTGCAAAIAEVRVLVRERDRLSKLQTALQRRARMLERTPKRRIHLRVEGLVLRGVWVDVGRGAERLPPNGAVSVGDEEA